MSCDECCKAEVAGRSILIYFPDYPEMERVGAQPEIGYYANSVSVLACKKHFNELRKLTHAGIQAREKFLAETGGLLELTKEEYEKLTDSENILREDGHETISDPKQ